MICFGEKIIIKHLKKFAERNKGSKYYDRLNERIKEIEKFEKDKNWRFFA